MIAQNCRVGGEFDQCERYDIGSGNINNDFATALSQRTAVSTEYMTHTLIGAGHLSRNSAPACV